MLSTDNNEVDIDMDQHMSDYTENFPVFSNLSLCAEKETKKHIVKKSILKKPFHKKKVVEDN